MLIMIGCIVTPTLLLLIIQTALFPITLHSHVHVNEVKRQQQTCRVLLQFLQENHAVDEVRYLCVYISKCLRCVCKCTSMCMCLHTHTYPYIHSHMVTYIHMYIYLHTHEVLLVYFLEFQQLLLIANFGFLLHTIV